MNKRVHQFHYWASPGDAITNQMRFLRTTLLAHGFESEIFSMAKRGNLPDVRQMDWEAAERADLFLIHHSQGTPNLDSLLRLPNRKGLIYHNITPSHFFKHDPTLESLCQLGRAQLKVAIQVCDLLFADSQYNAEELREMGAKAVELLPLFDLKEDQSTFSHSSAKRKNLLFVGRLCPHKDQALLIRVAHYLKAMRFAFELNLVGRGDPLYTLYLKKLIKRLRLEGAVTLRGSVSDEKLKEYYLSADAFVCVSAHEGFCIPVVEAMKYSLPIYSTTDAALRETLGEAGIQINTRDPKAIALLLAASLTDDSIQRKILESQKRQFKLIQNFQNSAQAYQSISRHL